MANMIHWLVLHTPLEVTELHHHSDALFPDVKRRALLEQELRLVIKH